MYDINDRAAAILRVQRYLLAVREGEEGAKNPIDGIFGSSTRDALLSYQETRGLSERGVVGPKTYEMLYGEYTGIADNALLVSDPYRSPILRGGDMGEEVRRLNSLLHEYFSLTGEFPPPTVTDTFGEETEARVRYLQSLWGWENAGEVDRGFMRRLTREIAAWMQYRKMKNGV